jgi:hypothetical protein
MADGQILPLVFDANTLESRFASESTEDRLLFVSPDSESELLIELTPVVSLGAFIENGARVFFSSSQQNDGSKGRNCPG